MSFQLRPTGLGCNNIKPVIVKENEECVVGRNSNTFSDVNCQNSPLISRKHAILEIRNGQLILKPISTLVYINEKQWKKDVDPSEIVLDYGDIVSLLGVANYFNFVVTGMGRTLSGLSNSLNSGAIAHDSSTACNPTVHPTVDSTVVPVPPVEVPKSELERSLECTICFELMACAHQLNSCQCGISYCYGCISALNMCPACRAPCSPSNLIPNRIVDEFCHTIIKDNKEALTDWELRTKAGIDLKKASNSSTSSSSSSSTGVCVKSNASTSARTASSHVSSFPPKQSKLFPNRKPNSLNGVVSVTPNMVSSMSKPPAASAQVAGSSRSCVVVLTDSDPRPKKRKTESIAPGTSSNSSGIISFTSQKPITKTKAAPIAAVVECIDLTQ